MRPCPPDLSGHIGGDRMQLKSKELEHVKTEKVEQLFRDKL